MSDEKQRKRILARVMERFSTAYNKEFSVEQIQLWYGQIAHLNEEAAVETADRCIAHSKWMPSVSEFLEISRQVRRHQEDAARPPVRRLEAHIKEMQDKGLAVQRALVKTRVGRKPHDHRQGSENCPVCAPAADEANADECGTCYLLEEHGIKVSHHKG